MRWRLNSAANVFANSVLPTPTSPSSSSGRPSLRARKAAVARPRSGIYPVETRSSVSPATSEGGNAAGIFVIPRVGNFLKRDREVTRHSSTSFPLGEGGLATLHRCQFLRGRNHRRSCLLYFDT